MISSWTVSITDSSPEKQVYPLVFSLEKATVVHAEKNAIRLKEWGAIITQLEQARPNILQGTMLDKNAVESISSWQFATL